MCVYDIIQSVRVLSQISLKLLPRQSKQLTGDITMHDVNKVLELVSVSLQLTNLEVI